MSIGSAQIGVQFYVKVWSPIANSPDTTLYGVYRIHTPRGAQTREQLAAASVAYVTDVVGLRQRHLAMIQVYDRNGHEVSLPNFQWDYSSIFGHTQVERLGPNESPSLVDASRTIREVMSLPMTGEI